MRRCLLAGLCLTLGGAGTAVADHPGSGPDPTALQSSPVSDVPTAPSTRAAEPPLLPTPQGRCGRGSIPETGIQGRVSPEDHRQRARRARASPATPSWSASTGSPNAHRAPSAASRSSATSTRAGHECAYYDTTLLFPTNLSTPQGGVNVLDMTDPAQPGAHRALVTPAMLSPHESLVRQPGARAAGRRGRQPRVQRRHRRRLRRLAGLPPPGLKSSTPDRGLRPRERHGARRQHLLLGLAGAPRRSSPSTSPTPRSRCPLWFGNVRLARALDQRRRQPRLRRRHRLRACIILDTSRGPGARRDPDGHARSRGLTLDLDEHPAERDPVTIDGHPYLVEIDEFGAQCEVGAGRIIDIADETQPAGDLQPAPRGPPAGELRRRRPATPGPRTRSRATPGTTATCRRGPIRRSSPAA